MSAAAIELEGVSKRFGGHLAVADLSLRVEAGEAVGFLGANGAGKTTTMRLLTGFLRPSAGRVRLLGHDLARAEAGVHARTDLGYVPDGGGLDPAARGGRWLDELAALSGQPPRDRAALCAALALEERDLQRPIGALSRGTRQKLLLVQALQCRPRLLILDEPAEGLDPFGKQALVALLRAARDRGAAVFFSSHVLSDVEAACDRVALLRDGRLVAVDAIEQLRAGLPRRVTLRLRGPSTPALEARLAAVATDRPRLDADGSWRFAASALAPLLATLATLPLDDLAIEPPTLEEVFRRALRPDAAPQASGAPARDA